MRAIVIPRPGGPEVLTVEERPDPQPGPGEVRIRVRASGVNFADLMARMGLYPDAPPTPSVVGYEVSGVIDMIGPEVTDVAVGDRVLAPCMFGGYAEQVVVPEVAAVKMPEGMSFEVGAAIPVNYATAYHMLHHMGSVKAGEYVFVQAAAGGVGLAATDLAFAAGARVVALASASKFDFLRSRGVTDLVSRDEDQFEAIKRYTDKRGVDLYLDSEGGPGLRDSYSMLRSGGRLVCFGASSLVRNNKRDLLWAGVWFLGTPRFSPITLMNDNRAVLGVNMNTLSKRAPDLVAQEIRALLRLYEEGKLHPHVDLTVPPERAAEAHQYIHDRKNKGKVLIVWPE